MAKYYIESYKKIEQSFLGRVNSGKEPYEITLKKVSQFVWLTSTIEKIVELPIGFNAKKELTTGREWIN